MPDPILRPFRVQDLTVFNNRDGWQGNTLSLAIQQEQNGLAFTGICGEEILGCAGISIPWPGLGLCWMTVSERIDGHGLWLTRIVKRVLDDTIHAYRLHRLEAVALVDSAQNREWLERLGFTVEQDGIARAYLADGRDVVRYEWLIERKG